MALITGDHLIVIASMVKQSRKTVAARDDEINGLQIELVAGQTALPEELGNKGDSVYHFRKFDDRPSREGRHNLVIHSQPPRQIHSQMGHSEVARALLPQLPL